MFQPHFLLFGHGDAENQAEFPDAVRVQLARTGVGKPKEVVQCEHGHIPAGQIIQHSVEDRVGQRVGQLVQRLPDVAPAAFVECSNKLVVRLDLALVHLRIPEDVLVKRGRVPVEPLTSQAIVLLGQLCGIRLRLVRGEGDVCEHANRCGNKGKDKE